MRAGIEKARLGTFSTMPLRWSVCGFYCEEMCVVLWGVYKRTKYHKDLRSLVAAQGEAVENITPFRRTAGR